MDEKPDVPITSIRSILIITSIIGNSLVCAVIKKNQDMRIPTNFQLVNLAVADIIYSAFTIPELIFKFSRILIHQDGLAGRVLCALKEGTLTWVGAFSSAFTLAVMAMERYLLVTEPQSDIGKLTMSKLKVIIPGSWILALTLNIPEFLKLQHVTKLNNNDCDYELPEKWMNNASDWTWYIFFFLSSILMISLYSRVVRALWFRRNDDNELVYQQQDVLRVQKRVTLTALIISAIFVICWGCDLVYHFLKDVTTYNLSPLALPIAHTMVAFSAAVKPFAYALINRRFRETFKEVICCCSKSSAAAEHAPKVEEDVEIPTSIAAQPTANDLHQTTGSHLHQSANYKWVNIRSIAITEKAKSTTVTKVTKKSVFLSTTL